MLRPPQGEAADAPPKPVEPWQSPSARYRLFGTENFWTFLRLDTATGRISQVHFTVEEATARAVLPLNAVPLNSGTPKRGTFVLFPTRNMYSFILLDQDSGGVWQVQWSFKADERKVIPIRPAE